MRIRGTLDAHLVRNPLIIRFVTDFKGHYSGFRNGHTPRALCNIASHHETQQQAVRLKIAAPQAGKSVLAFASLKCRFGERLNDPAWCELDLR